MSAIVRGAQAFSIYDTGVGPDVVPGWQPKKHSARWTKEYLYHQLIPYIGNKRKLLTFIAKAIARTGESSGTFLDLFAGSGAVSRLAKVLGFRVISNDWEPYTREINTAYIALDEPPAFARLGGMEAVYSTLNAFRGRSGYISKHYCPRNDKDPDPARERMFFTRKNGCKIDAIGEEIEDWTKRGYLSREEKSVLLTSLIYATSYVSNTSGVFKGFHRGWGGRNGTALYRILSDLELKPPVFYEGNRKAHEVFMEDANTLVLKLPPVKIAYLDPPYNQHQYGSNYHILNTVTLWDKPKVLPTILVNGKMHEKSAIRKDWRTNRRSRYCYQATAKDAFESLLANLKAKWVLVSYSAEGIVGLEEMLEILKTHGEVEILRKGYKRYRVSPTRPSMRPLTTEFVLILNKGMRSNTTHHGRGSPGAT